MVVIPNVKLVNEEDTDYIYIDCILKTLPSGNMIKDLHCIISANFIINDRVVPLKGSRDNEHWYTYINYKELSGSDLLVLELCTEAGKLKFNV